MRRAMGCLLGLAFALWVPGCGGRESLGSAPGPVSPSQVDGAFTLDFALVDAGGAMVGPPVVSHNALLVFPVDLSARVRVVTALTPATAFIVGSKSTCTSAAAPGDINWNINGPGENGPVPPSTQGHDVTSVSLTMPYRVPADDFVRVPDGLCVAARRSGSIEFVLIPERVAAVHDDAAQVASAMLAVNQQDVDALAVLFETTTVVSRVVIATGR